MRGDESLKIGGQAVIEGVMMRAPGAVAVAVRKQSGEIVVKRDPHTSLSERRRVFGFPIVRGFVTLIETLVMGLSALNFSADVAMEEEAERERLERGEELSRGDGRRRSRLVMPLVLIAALALGILFFFYLPLVLASLVTGAKGSVAFNLVDGLIRIVFFFLYLVGITLLPDVKRVFQYHGAEHKSIYCYEQERSLSVERAADYPRLHARCGTSFLLIVMVVAIAIFAILDSILFDLLGLPSGRVMRFVVHLGLLPLVAGLAYEFIRWAGKASDNPLKRTVVWPGLVLQRMTTREPDRSQLEVALVALREALGTPGLRVEEGASSQVSYRRVDTASAAE